MTTTLNGSHLRGFEACSSKPTSKGLPSSFLELMLKISIHNEPLSFRSTAHNQHTYPAPNPPRAATSSEMLSKQHTYPAPNPARTATSSEMLSKFGPSPFESAAPRPLALPAY